MEGRSTRTPGGVAALAAAVAARHGVDAAGMRPLTGQGVANRTLALGPDLVLRVARPGHEGDLAAEAAVLPAALAAGLPVPELVDVHLAGPGAGATTPPHEGAWDEWAWVVQRRCPGVRLDSPALAPAVRSAGHRDLGRLLRVLHDADLQPVPALAAAVRDDAPDDVAAAVGEATAAGWIAPQDASWVLALADHLAAAAARGAAARTARRVVVHGDASASNVLVDPADGRVAALLDWGDTARTAASSDLAKVAPHHLPDAVAGYVRATDAAAADAGEERAVAAAALGHHLCWGLGRLGTAPRPGDLTWSAPPAARLLGLLRLAGEVAARPRSPWGELLAPATAAP